MKTRTIKVQINKKPVALARPRFRRIGKNVSCYNVQAKDENDFKKIVLDNFSEDDKSFIKEIYDTDYYVAIDCEFYIQTQKADSAKKKALKENGSILPRTRPDVDNYIKFVLDALHDAIYKDDNIVTDVSAKKRYSENPRTVLNITFTYDI